MSMRSSLGRARGLGSTGEGVGHWWVQRATAVALVPLALWLVISVIRVAGADYQHFQQWLARPGNATLMVLLLVATFHHAQLGLQVVIEDYVHRESTRIAGILVMKAIIVLLGTFSVVSVLKIAFGG
ncbi:MAG: succinate dehydrogenase, hydrophobic membrane anchor protein [Alphaproteobacteria bacterium]